MSSKIRGVVPPLAIPLKDGELDVPSLERHINRLINAAAFLQVVNHLCKCQRNFWLTERDFQQFHHLIIGQFSRTDQKTFQHSGTSAKTMHALFSVQL